MEERTARLEQRIDELSIAFNTHSAEMSECMKMLTHKLRRRRRSGSGVIENEGKDGETDGSSSTDTEPSVKERPKPHHRYRGRKLEIPVFEGEEAYGWLVKVERYFKINGVEEDEMLEAVVIALDGRALNWYQWWEEQHPEPSWVEFKQAVIRRFQPALVRNPLGPILNVKQSGTVMEYREQFEMLIAPLKHNERVMLESIFLNGLREEIQTELKLHNTRGLNAMMDRALLIEERNRALRNDSEKLKEKSEGAKWKSGFSGSGQEMGKNRVFVAKPKTVTGSSTHGPSEAKVPSGEDSKKQGMGKRLSQDELRDLSKKGLCFKCVERWGRDHVCKMKHYRIELVEDEEDDGSEGESEKEEEVVVVQSDIVAELKTLLLSLRSQQGLTSNQSFKVWGVINGRKVLILIDSGASSNFISHELVKELQLQLEETGEYTIEIGNGDKLTHRGVCVDLRVQVQSIDFTQNFFLMSLTGTDVVLGMDWLASLGDIKANFKNLVIKWKGGGQKFKIKGEPSLSKHQASLKSMMKSMKTEEDCYIVHLYQLKEREET